MCLGSSRGHLAARDEGKGPDFRPAPAQGFPTSQLLSIVSSLWGAHCSLLIDHLLLLCQWAFQLWVFVLNMLGLPWVQMKQVGPEILGLVGFAGKGKVARLRAVPLAVFWILWLVVGCRIFEAMESTLPQLRTSCGPYFGDSLLL